MDCPICNVPLKEIDYEGVKVDHCDECDGFWLDDGEIKKINLIHEKTFSPEQIAQAREMVEKKAMVAEGTEARRIKCPHCGKECEQVSSSGVTVDECPDGKGIWLDKGEIEKLQVMAEERGRIFTDEQKKEFEEREERNRNQGSLWIFDQFSIFLHRLLKRG